MCVLLPCWHDIVRVYVRRMCVVKERCALRNENTNGGPNKSGICSERVGIRPASSPQTGQLTVGLRRRKIDKKILLHNTVCTFCPFMLRVHPFVACSFSMFLTWYLFTFYELRRMMLTLQKYFISSSGTRSVVPFFIIRTIYPAFLSITEFLRLYFLPRGYCNQVNFLSRFQSPCRTPWLLHS